MSEDHIDQFGFNFSAWMRGDGPCQCWGYDASLHGGHCGFLNKKADGPDFCHDKPDGLDEALECIAAAKAGGSV